MKIELDKQDLVYLLKGVHPGFSIMEELQEKNIGRYSDNRGWTWNDTMIDDMSEEQLFALFERCKASLR